MDASKAEKEAPDGEGTVSCAGIRQHLLSFLEGLCLVPI
jgi:hypothetical protein